MTKALVPSISRDLGTGVGMMTIVLGRTADWNWVETTLASTVKKDPLRGSILDKEKTTMKFNKDIVIA